MKKIKNFIFFLWVYLLTSLTIQAVTTDVLSFYTNKAIIEGITTRVDFTTDLRVKIDNPNINQFISLYDSQKYDKNSFIKYENLQILNTNSSSIRFPSKEDILEFRVKGTLIFYWDKYKINFPNRVTLGEVYSNINNQQKKSGTIDIILNDLNIVSILKVNVKNHMNFGTIIAGQKASTKESSRTPAKIEIEGSNNQKVKITIPESAEIKNSSGDTILVNLDFRDNQAIKNSNGKKSIIKNISSENSKNGIGKTDPIKIDGDLVTSKKNRGNYKGTFVVRVEYEN